MNTPANPLDDTHTAGEATGRLALNPGLPARTAPENQGALAETGKYKSMEQLIAAAIHDPAIDPAKLHSLMDLNIRLMDKQAEIDFNQSLFRAQQNMPRVKKNGVIRKKDGTIAAKYMKLEDIDGDIREIYEAEGFCIMDSQRENPNGTVTVFSTLVHKNGHSKTVEVTVPKDKENALKNALQASVGTVTTGKRVNVCNLFRIIAEDDSKAEDVVTTATTQISDDQAALLKDLIRETGTDTIKFLNTMVSGVKSVDEISIKDFDRIYNTLLSRKKKIGPL